MVCERSDFSLVIWYRDLIGVRSISASTAGVSESFSARVSLSTSLSLCCELLGAPLLVSGKDGWMLCMGGSGGFPSAQAPSYTTQRLRTWRCHLEEVCTSGMCKPRIGVGNVDTGGFHFRVCSGPMVGRTTKASGSAWDGRGGGWR